MYNGYSNIGNTWHVGEAIGSSSDVDFLYNPLGLQRGLQDQITSDPNLTADESKGYVGWPITRDELRPHYLRAHGLLEIGECAVWVGVSAPHRDEAFRACRALVDRIKERVPIWKREHGPQGPYWVGWKENLAVPGGD